MVSTPPPDHDRTAAVRRLTPRRVGLGVSRAFWKRPAWVFSARARVANQSAISSKPSSRAVFAQAGYIAVNSWSHRRRRPHEVLLRVADRLVGGRVSDDGEEVHVAEGVAGLALRGRRKRPAVARCRLRCLRDERNRGRRFAWLSPANAAFRLFSVFEPFSDDISGSPYLPLTTEIPKEISPPPTALSTI